MTAEMTRADAVESLLIQGDLSKLSADQRVSYYQRVCDSLGLNPLTKPFEYLSLNGRLVLYAKRDCTEQLRKIHAVSVAIASREITEGVYVVTAKAGTPDGRADESIGAVTVEGLKGEARANAMMKAETKAKRRVTLSICGLGILDESEIGDTPAPVRQVPPEQPKELPPADEPDTDEFDPLNNRDDMTALLTQKNRTWEQALKWLSEATKARYTDSLQWVNFPAEHRKLLVDAVTGALPKKE